MKAKHPNLTAISLLLALIFVLIAWLTKIQGALGRASSIHLPKVVLAGSGQLDENDPARNRELYGYTTISPVGEVGALGLSPTTRAS